MITLQSKYILYTIFIYLDLRQSQTQARLYPEDPILRAQRKQFLDKFKDLGLYLFRGTLSQNAEKKKKDFRAIAKLLKVLEAKLEESETKYLFNEKQYTFVDVALVVLVERLFFFKNSDIGPIVNYDFLDNLPNIEKWVAAIRSRKELQKAITNEVEFQNMIKDFLQSGKWGLKYPLAKL